MKKIPVLEITVLSIAVLMLSDLLPLQKSWIMSTATAATFILAASSKLLFQFFDGNRKLLVLVRALALCTLLIGLLRTSAIIFKFNSSDLLSDMVLVTGIGFIFLGTALYFLTLHNSEKITVPHIFSLGTLCIALLSAIAYTFHENLLYETDLYMPMRISSAICFSLLAVSILLVNKHKGIMGDLTSKYQGSKIARVLIPVAIITPVLLGFFQLRSGETGHYSRPYDLALLTLGRIIILVIFIWRTAVIINRSNKALVAEIEERKKNEDTLRYRKALLEAQNEAIPDAILVVDTAGKILSFNHHFAELWRIPQNIINERDDTAALKFAMTQLANPTEFIRRVNYIYAHPEESAHDEILFKDGRIIERYGNVVMGEDGKRYGWAWYFRDITQNKNFENTIKNFNKELEEKVRARTQELNKSEKRFRSLIENANDIISLSDENGMRFYVSPAIERITGFTMEETINRQVFDSVYPDDIEKVKAIRDELIREPGVIKPLSCRFKHKNGGYVWIEGTLINLLHDENVKAIVGNYHDVTERKIIEEKIRISNERFEMVSKATNDTVWDWNLETDEVYWNDVIKSMFNYSPKHIPDGNSWKMYIHPEDLKRVTKKIEYHIKEGIENWQDEYRFLCADGTYKDIFDRGFILTDRNNKPYRMIGAMQDITELHILQKKVIDEKINKQKDLTNASIKGQEKERAEIGRELHDNINQLLTATKLYLDVASRQPDMKDEMIARSVDNITQCMEEIRRLSSALVPPSIDINNFDDIIKDLIEPVNLATAINISYDVSGVNKNILSNDQLLNVYRILQEHLNNILKHAKANNVIITVKHIDGHIDINIKDDGQGFDISDRRKGIGFKNIQSRAELLNGEMKIFSQPGEGCLLSVNFPVNGSTI